MSNLTSACNKIIQMDNITSKDVEMTTKYLINELENFIKINYTKIDLNKYKKDGLINIIKTETPIKLNGREKEK